MGGKGKRSKESYGTKNRGGGGNQHQRQHKTRDRDLGFEGNSLPNKEESSGIKKF